jgi:putative phosphoesterase
MKIGVVSDTHNNIANVKKIISIFNDEFVDYVIHTGDITNKKTLEQFSTLRARFLGVLGNNDREELGLLERSEELGFQFVYPPSTIRLENRQIAIFHEPELIENYIKKNSSVDLVLHGHTHRYREEEFNGVKIFNPGESAGFMEGKNAVGLVDLNSLHTRRIFF